MTVRGRWYWALLALALFVACAHRATVAEIQKDPGAYSGKTISVRGTVRGATKLPFMNEGFFRLDDGTGSMVVITRGEMPAEGKKDTARGKVESTFQIGGRAFGLVLVSEDR